MAMDSPTLEEHKARVAEIIGDISWRAVRMPAEERAGYIWVTLARLCEIYVEKYGDLEVDDARELAEHLFRWTEETVRMLEMGRDDGIWEAIWGGRAA